jgi:hypothetical protein
MSLIHRVRPAFTATSTITFCESRSQVCDATCRANAVRTMRSTPRYSWPPISTTAPDTRVPEVLFVCVNNAGAPK